MLERVAGMRLFKSLFLIFLLILPFIFKIEGSESELLFTFAVMSDVHAGRPYSRGILQDAYNYINDTVQLILWGGDNTNNGDSWQYDEIRSIIVPNSAKWNKTRFANGNHDIHDTGERYTSLYNRFCNKFEVSSVNYTFLWTFRKGDKEYQFFFVILEQMALTEAGRYFIKAEQIAWCKNQLNLHSNLNAFIVIHVPDLSTGDPHYTNGNWTLLIDSLKQTKNIVAIFSGHHHGGGFKWHTADDGHKFLLKWVTSMRVGTERDHKGYVWFLNVYMDRIETYGYSPTEKKYYLDESTFGDVLNIPLAHACLDIIPPIAKAGLDQTVKAGEEVNLDASQSSDNIGIVSYLWDFGDGTTGTGKTTTHIYSNPGIYIVKLTVMNAAGNSATDTTTITVEEAPFSWWTVGTIMAVGITATLVTVISHKKRKKGSS